MSTVIEPNARARAADPGLNARRVISKRYSLKDAAGNPLEDWEAVVRRVVTHVCMAEPGGRARDDFHGAMTDIMLRREFVPNTPCLVNAGKANGQLAACFVLDVPDSIAGIMKTATDAAIIHQTGGGTGFTFEKVRPQGSMVRSTHGVASGPVSFMNIFNTTTDTVKQGGVRRGANMGIMRCSHPDVLRFIHAKNDQHSLTNFNISVTVTDTFFDAVNSREWAEQWFQLSFEGNAWTEPVHDPVQDGPYCLYMLDGAPLTFRDRAAFLKAEESGLLARCSKVEPPRPGMIHAPDVWNRIIASAHAYAEPGVIFIDEVNRHNLLMASMGPKLATNPCVTGESLVYTERGLKTVRELYESREHPDVTLDSRFGFQPTFGSCSPVFRTGRKPVFRLQTREGYFVRATADHLIMTNRGWVEVRDLQQGDRIHVLNRKGGFGTKGTLEEGLVWGWLVGDGSISAEGNARASLYFYGSERALAPTFATYVNDMVAGVGLRSREYRVGTVSFPNDRLGVQSVRLRVLGDALGLTENKLQVPHAIRSASEQMQRGFLQGLFSADGTVADNRGKGCSVRLTSVSRTLLEGVQQLLLNFGIASRLYLNRRRESNTLMPDGRGGKRLYDRQPIHELAIARENIRTFAAEINFLQTEKREKLETCLRGFVRRMNRESFTARVASVMPDGEEDVFDLTQGDTHSFVANGIVVHNCAEEALHANNSCNLGSIDLAKFYTPTTRVDWERLAETTRWCVRFLDNVVDTCAWPLEEIDDVVKRTRPVGLGVMGFADLFLLNEITYGSDESIALIGEVMSFVRREAWAESCRLGTEKGVFPEYHPNRAAYDHFLRDVIGLPGDVPLTPRNYEVTTIAPTGTISLVAETSSGIEPNFDWAYVREDTIGKRTYVHTLAAQALGIEVDQTDQESIDRAAAFVVEHQGNLPPHFISAMSVTAERHVRVLAAAQRHVDNGVSKTCNGAADDTVESVD
ncbi:MAG: LAGLIDADG family homing endonuclease, partial [Pyrinomonadaceae bacterium]